MVYAFGKELVSLIGWSGVVHDKHVWFMTKHFAAVFCLLIHVYDAVPKRYHCQEMSHLPFSWCSKQNFVTEPWLMQLY